MHVEDICADGACDRAVYRRGYCYRHYKDALASGTLKRLRVRDGVCSVDGCDRKHFSRGLCQSHHGRWRRTGSAGAPEFQERKPVGTQCLEENLTFCVVHERRRLALADGEKSCGACGCTKQLAEFSEHPTGIAGRNSYCKACVIQRVKESIARRGPEALREYAREYSKRPGARSIQNAHCQDRRAKLRLAFVEHVDRFKVYWSHLGKCGICGETVAVDDFHVDHIVPLARGGEHSYANTQPAHPSCNVRKGAKVGYTEVSP